MVDVTEKMAAAGSKALHAALADTAPDEAQMIAAIYTAMHSARETDQGVVERVKDALWREDYLTGEHDPEQAIYYEPHDDDWREWPADSEKLDRQARAAISAMKDNL